MLSKRRKICHITSNSEIVEEISHITSNSDATKEGIQFLDLPPLILYKILGYLPQKDLIKNVSVVCKSLREISYDPVLLRTYKVFKCDSLNVMTQNLVRMPLLQNLKIQCLDWKSNEYFPAIHKLCPKITSITVTKLYDVQVLKNISHYFPDLETLHILYCEQYNTLLETHGTAKIVSSLKRLRHLMLTLEDICYQCGYNCLLEQVQDLELFETACGLSHRDVLALIKNSGRTLKNLYVGESLDDWSCLKLTECKQLQVLNFIDVGLLTDKGLAALTNLPKLRRFGMGYAKLITARGLQRIFESGKLRNLEVLTLCEFPLDDDVVEAICKNCKYLKCLFLGQTEDSVTDEAIQAIVNNLRYLEKLTLESMGNITGRCLVKIPEKLPDLKILKLKKCKSIDEQVMKNLENNSRLEVLYKFTGTA